MSASGDRGDSSFGVQPVGKGGSLRMRREASAIAIADVVTLVRFGRARLHRFVVVDLASAVRACGRDWAQSSARPTQVEYFEGQRRGLFPATDANRELTGALALLSAPAPRIAVPPLCSPLKIIVIY